MTQVKKKLSPQSTHFQRLYSGYGIENLQPSEDFWKNVWEDKPRICLVDIFDTLKEKKTRRNRLPVNSFQKEVDVDFTNSRQFNLGKWRRNDFFNLNKGNGTITCSRHSAHMKHLESFDSVRLKKNRLQNMIRRSKKMPSFEHQPLMRK